MLRSVNHHLNANGFKVGTGTIMDATLIAAPSSTRNEKGERDPEMHQTKKGNQWYLGTKGNIGVDYKEWIIHSLEVTSANVHDSRVIADLFHARRRRFRATAPVRAEASDQGRPRCQVHDFTESRTGSFLGHRPPAIGLLCGLAISTLSARR